MRRRTYSNTPFALDKTIRRIERRASFTAIAVFLWFALWLTIVVGAIYVAIHFILKYW